MRTTNITKKLKEIGMKHRVSIESANVNIPAEPVEQQPTMLPYARDEDQSDETGVTMQEVEPTELYEELEVAIADIALDITTIENLSIVSNLSSRNLNNAALEEFVKTTVGLESATRLLSSTTTGGIQCSADVISLEEIAGNAAKAGWDNIYRKVMALLNKTKDITDTTTEAGTRIQEQFRAVKKAAFEYRGGSEVNIGVMGNGDSDLNRVISNTKVAILEDLGGKASGALDKAINDLTKQATNILTSKKGEISSIVANGVKTADNLSSAYKIKDPEFTILGFTRKTLDDQLTLPQGIIGALSGNGRVYNYPRYSANKQSRKIVVELKPNTVKDLYSIGMNIGNEIADQARIWPQRLDALKTIADMAKKQSGDVDADRNTWSAEQTAAKNTLKMWNANASARKHYINVYNKIASEILEVLNHVSGSTASTEAFGGFFTKKPKEESTPQLPVHKPDLKALIKSTAFPGFIDNYVADITAYNDDFKQHVASMHKACGEIGKSFNESNINKYVDDLKKLADDCYARFREGNPDETDWREIGNQTLELFTLELKSSKLMSKHFGMHYDRGVYTTRFDYAPNYLINDTTTENLENKRLIKRRVSGFTKETAMQFFSVMDSIDEINLPRGLDGCLFLRENPRFEDALTQISIEPLLFVTSRLFEIMDESYFAIRDGLNKE